MCTSDSYTAYPVFTTHKSFKTCQTCLDRTKSCRLINSGWKGTKVLCLVFKWVGVGVWAENLSKGRAGVWDGESQ